MERIDLRSDTVTLPSPGMRQAMAAAPVGDDEHGGDGRVSRLQERIAELLGKEAALLVPSGTMANQIGLKILTRPGDDVVVGDEAHIVWHESGAAAANSGVQFTVAGRGGLFTTADLRAAYKPPGHIVFPPTTLVAIANTHTRGGGRMRQSGILAAAGLYALDHNLARLVEDHANARLLAERLAGLRRVRLDLATVQSNIVIFRMQDGAPDAAAIVARAQETGVLISAFGERTVRAVTHLDVSRQPCRRAAGLLAEVSQRR